MNYLSADGIAKAFGERVLFSELTFGLAKGDKVALIAQNGTGKSSMLEIICGREAPDQGRVVLRKGIRLGYLQQEPEFDDSASVQQVLEESHSHYRSLQNEYEEIIQNKNGLGIDEHAKALETITAKMDATQAWDYEDRLKQLLASFAFTTCNKK